MTEAEVEEYVKETLAKLGKCKYVDVHAIILVLRDDGTLDVHGAEDAIVADWCRIHDKQVGIALKAVDREIPGLPVPVVVEVHP